MQLSMLHFQGFLCSMQLNMLQFPGFLREQHAGTDRPTQKGPQSPVDISELKLKLIPGIFKVEIEMTYYWMLIPKTNLIE